MFRSLLIVAALLPFLAAGAHAQGYGGGQIECRSRNYDYTECQADFRQPRLVQQLSQSECIEDRSWGYVQRRGIIWVSAGCAGVFVDEYEDRGRGRRDEYGRRDEPQFDSRPHRRERQREEISCRSDNYAFTRCGVSWREAELLEQLSHSDCIEGESWGLDNDGLWVDKGCAGRFAGY
jgi:hypothetical protein